MGFVTDALGLTDNEGEKKAAKNAQANADRSYAMTAEQLEFQKEQYADWKNVYGDLQTNLGDYFKNLDSNDVAALGLENQQREFQAAQKQIQTNFAQRGITPTSGISAATDASLNFANAEARAKIRTNAPTDTANQKLDFLKVGLGQGTQMLNTIAQTSANGSSNAAGLAGNFLNQQTNLSNSNTSTMNDLFGAAGFLG